jgi:hypothetical protein
LIQHPFMPRTCPPSLLIRSTLASQPTSPIYQERCNYQHENRDGVERYSFSFLRPANPTRPKKGCGSFQPISHAYRALRFAKASGECRPLSEFAIAKLSLLTCRTPPFPPIFGLPLPLPLFFRNGFRLPVSEEEVVDGAGIVTLRFAEVAPDPA